MAKEREDVVRRAKEQRRADIKVGWGGGGREGRGGGGRTHVVFAWFACF